MLMTDTQEIDGGLLSSLLSDEAFWPSEPRTIAETGLTECVIESLVLKFLLVTGTTSGRKVAENTALPFGLLDEVLTSLRTRQMIVHAGSAPFNDYYYTLTERGREFALAFQQACSYVGPAPVPLMDYIISVEAQAIGVEAIRRAHLQEAFAGISVDDDLFELLGPAVNSGAGLFLYGTPGNGKSTLAKRLTRCFGQQIWLPHALIEDGQIIKIFDASYHKEVKSGESSFLKAKEFDRRWVKIQRPTVVVGGELTMDSLEIRHDHRTNISEASLQMKSNCGCLLIDDFGRQRVAPVELLNRWIVPLEGGHDFLTLSTGKKIQVPFDQLVIFSTNLDPCDLVDEAFLRRIPYKIEIHDPDEQEFHQLFEIYTGELGCSYDAEVVEYVLETYYRRADRPMRRCHPRDILIQIKNHCTYNDLPFELRREYVEAVARSYFTVVFDNLGH
ncbi:MAG TPA: AAA family ATPase [Planctomycetaceae bacterium]|nr:AAA family ATPase [Planctomycetaceae bacterium]